MEDTRGAWGQVAVCSSSFVPLSDCRRSSKKVERVHGPSNKEDVVFLAILVRTVSGGREGARAHGAEAGTG